VHAGYEGVRKKETDVGLEGERGGLSHWRKSRGEYHSEGIENFGFLSMTVK